MLLGTLGASLFEIFLTIATVDETIGAGKDFQYHLSFYKFWNTRELSKWT